MNDEDDALPGSVLQSGDLTGVFYRDCADEFVDILEEALRGNWSYTKVLRRWSQFCGEKGCNATGKSKPLLQAVIDEYHGRGLHLKESRYRVPGIVI